MLLKYCVSDLFEGGFIFLVSVFKRINIYIFVCFFIFCKGGGVSEN